ncbi:ABC transporter permease [Photorhabdus sp. CRCIA-P01]|uniref:ABC transporter permease n=1 Tax=Photorhabdus sp. CRCIA-P01 TaxID=2019570 RepID=UPI000E5998FB|nr:ABC transporter permease [Photorhabdus sp. CRCIA-P01]
MPRIVSSKKSKTSLREIIDSRYIILQLVKRDFSVRYKQTSLGWLWAVINPLANFILFAVVFGLLVRVPTPEYAAPYSAVLVVGIIYWNFFSACMSSVSDSLINNIHLIKKVYFPRIVFGLSSTFVAVVDFIIAFVFFIPVLIYLKVNINITKLLLITPVAVFTTILFAWGLGCFMSILKVRYKDFRHFIPLFMQILFYISPIVYTASIIPDEYQFYYQINPLVHIIELARYGFLGGNDVPSIAITFTASVLVAVLGGMYFIYNERKVVDLE